MKYNQQDAEPSPADSPDVSSESEDEQSEDTDSEEIHQLERRFLQQQREMKNRFSFEDFDTIKTVGTGTFGRVVLVRHRETECYYAMKMMIIHDVLRLKQVEHVRNEKNILMLVQHPFIVQLHWTHHDDTYLYMMFDYMSGGELFTYLRGAGHFESKTACFYAAEIVLALEYLHSLSIAYRDLKPENLLLDREGHLKITDFGFAKQLNDRTWTLCGTPEYLAPEVIQSKGHNKAVDWWALGILIYEMLTGYPPFYDDNPYHIYEKIVAGKIEWPHRFDPVAKDLVKKLLVQDRTRRLGNMKKGATDVKNHRWFQDLHWGDLFHRELKPPITPRVRFEGDTDNFDDYPEDETKKTPEVSGMDQAFFSDF